MTDDARPTADVLVAYAGRAKETKAIAVALVDQLSRAGLTADLADADAGGVPFPGAYEAIVLGSCVQFGRNPTSLIAYVQREREALAARPTFFYSIGDDADIAGISRSTGWRPTGTAVFARTRPDHRRFLKRLGGHAPLPTEVAAAESRRVRAFAQTIGQAVGMPAPEALAVRAGARHSLARQRRTRA